ncbi:MAG: tRNA (adenosine(37)-N6)-threonylcarbamoyltransferase complex dimerization subunit type 1 TsaB [Rikenellaceae bacterium]|jgi:tRNA threonylcarbamoyladenosine biosynthesis protein TsaB|nr:tRNA (adenosine(37)-N6)-threonylcarbamoyltransferase complex dimerization subunit type 1 TsaB [Rikenellaceae bacterium]
MATILCIETATGRCSAALARDGAVVAVRESDGGRDHARDLAVYVDELLRDAGKLSSVAVSMGPGSYTGLRIGVSLAKGLCYALGVPLIAVDSLLSLAAVALEDGVGAAFEEGALLCPMIDARRMEVYTAVFDSSLRRLTPTAAHIIDRGSFAEFAATGRLTVFGDGAAKCAGVLPASVRYMEVKASARGLAKASQEAFDAGRFEDAAYFEPLYLKEFVAIASKKNPFLNR